MSCRGSPVPLCKSTGTKELKVVHGASATCVLQNVDSLLVGLDDKGSTSIFTDGTFESTQLLWQNPSLWVEVKIGRKFGTHFVEVDCHPTLVSNFKHARKVIDTLRPLEPHVSQRLA